MRRRKRKLELSRATLRTLSAAELDGAAGGGLHYSDRCQTMVRCSSYNGHDDVQASRSGQC